MKTFADEADLHLDRWKNKVYRGASLPPPGSGEGPPEQEHIETYERLDRFLKKHRNVPGLDRAIRDAFLLGKAAGLHGIEDRADIGEKRRQKQTEVALKRGKQTTDMAVASREETRVLAEEYRAEYPYDRSEESTEKMAIWIKSKRGIPKSTIHTHLRDLGIR